jgi:voltage-gated sodium channel
VLTLEGWVDVLAPQQAAYPVLAPLYFVSFILLGTMIVLNLFIGVIVNGMSEAQADLLLEKARKEGDEVRDTLREVENQIGRLRMLLDKRESDLAQARQLLKSAANDGDPRRERLKAV